MFPSSKGEDADAAHKVAPTTEKAIYKEQSWITYEKLKQYRDGARHTHYRRYKQVAKNAMGRDIGEGENA